MLVAAPDATTKMLVKYYNNSKGQRSRSNVTKTHSRVHCDSQ